MNNIVKHFAVLLLMLLFAGKAVAAADDEMLNILMEMKAEIKSLKAQAEKSNARISELENQLAESRNQQAQAAIKQPVADNKPTTGLAQASSTPGSSTSTEAKESKTSDKPAVTAGDIKGTFKIPGTDTSVGMGGFVKTDAMYSSVSAGSGKAGNQQLVFSDIPVGNGRTGLHSQMDFLAKDSRLWFKTFTPSKLGDINTFVEFDFNGDPDPYKYTPRLRHAYGSLGNFLAGQTWTTYLNDSALGDHLDIGNSAGAIAKLRQPLFRWTQPFSWQDMPMEFQAAVEAPRSNVVLPQDTTAFTTANDDRYPDLVARFNFKPEWGNISLAALGRQVRVSKTTGVQNEVWGGGVNLAGKIFTFGLDNVRFMAHYGNGDGRYTIDNNTFEDAKLSSPTNMELVTTYGGMLSYQHWWNEKWRSNLTYGYAHGDQPSFASSLLNRQVQSVHANLLWSPVSQTVMGVEYIYAIRELVNGSSGDLHRVQLSARYNF